ncbi:MAG: hypothetical protein PUH70_10720 [Clostridiales bacterium]|nr:hypothetical protein [Clostridiales bacterium]
MLTVSVFTLMIAPCVINLIVWVYVLLMALITRGRTSRETDRSLINARYGIALHDDLIAVVSGSISSQVKCFFCTLVLIVAWYFFCYSSELSRVLMLLTHLLVLNLGMLVLNRVFCLFMQLAVRTQVDAVGKLKAAMWNCFPLHIIVLILTFTANWMMTL